MLLSKATYSLLPIKDVDKCNIKRPRTLTGAVWGVTKGGTRTPLSCLEGPTVTHDIHHMRCHIVFAVLIVLTVLPRDTEDMVTLRGVHLYMMSVP